MDRQKLLEQLDELESKTKQLLEVVLAEQPKDMNADYLGELPSPKTDSGDMLQK